MTDSVTACIALGSNLGDRAGNIHAAIERLRNTEGINVVAVSSLYETKPVGGSEDQPRYLNAAAMLHTTTSPGDLMRRLLNIERDLGRTRDPTQKWGPRLIDLDLLLYGDRVIDEPGLTVPHPHMHERLFVLDPLCEIAADLVHPGLGRPVASIRKSLTAALIAE